MLTLTRELRFGLDEVPNPQEKNSGNGFAGNPPLLGIAPFLKLTATISGGIDPATGMLVNIKTIDHLLRIYAVPFLREKFESPRMAMPELFSMMAQELAPHRLESLALSLSPYLSLASHKENPAMVRLALRFEFSAAHRLYSAALTEQQNWDTFGRCTNANGHGHNYELEVSINAAPDKLLSVPALQKIVNETIISPFDHKHLNLDLPDFQPPGGLNPTVENIARVIYLKLKPGLPQLHSIRLWETPKTVAEYSE